MTILSLYPKQCEAFTFVLTGQKVCVGHASGNDIVLEDVFCSGLHAAIVPTKDGYAIEDQGSKNGTFLNGRRLEASTALTKGDEILIGSTRIVYDGEVQPDVALAEDDAFDRSSRKTLLVTDILRKTTTIISGTSIDSSAGNLPQSDQKMITILGEVSQALIYHMPLDPLLDYIMNLITKNIPMDRGVLMLKEGRSERLVEKVVRIQSASPMKQNLVVSQSILRASLEKNSSILISDIHSDRQLSEQESVVLARIHSAMCVPLWNNREIIGLIYADRTDCLGGFSEEDLRLLTLLANLAAIKIENTRLVEASQEKALLEKELQMAVGIWRNLLPKKDPLFEPFDISGNAWPCRYIGGDYFDFIPIDHSRLGLVIADVAGHGVGAALLATSLRSSLHAAITTMSDLALLAGKLNETVHRDADSHTFISFFFGVLDRVTNELTYVNAGHNPPLLVDPAGGIRLLDSTGLCLGMFSSAIYEIRTLRIEPGETLCLYTDGIVEGRSLNNEAFLIERLMRQVRLSTRLSARELLEGVYTEFSSFASGVEPADDITLVVVKRRVAGLQLSDGREVKELRVVADLAELDRVREFLRENLDGLPTQAEDALKIELATHEICTNIALHAYPQEGGSTTVRIWVSDGKIYVETRDRGIPYNPAAETPLDLREKIRMGTRGGLGVFLIKNLVDGCAYQRAGDENVLTIYKDCLAKS